MARRKKKRVKDFLSIGERATRFNEALARSNPFGIEPTPEDSQSGLFGFFSRGRQRVEQADFLEKLKRRGRLF